MNVGCQELAKYLLLSMDERKLAGNLKKNCRKNNTCEGKMSRTNIKCKSNLYLRDGMPLFPKAFLLSKVQVCPFICFHQQSYIGLHLREIISVTYCCQIFSTVLAQNIYISMIKIFTDTKVVLYIL